MWPGTGAAGIAPVGAIGGCPGFARESGAWGEFATLRGPVGELTRQFQTLVVQAPPPIVKVSSRHGSNQGNTCARAIRRRKPLRPEDIGQNWPPAGRPKVLP